MLTFTFTVLYRPTSQPYHPRIPLFRPQDIQRSSTRHDPLVLTQHFLRLRAIRQDRKTD